ncbi:MAG: ABC transporter permease [Flavobacteriales bacterium]|jgi:ABC-2 type transport system permease protein|nr:ABC transporter permease [Flavobacteriales bacterium]
MMNNNLFTKELKRNRKNLTIWSTITVGFTFMILSIYPFMQEMGQDLTVMMDKMPAELSKAMGMDSQTWSSILGFYSTYYGIYIIVLIGIFSTSTAATIISKEEKDGTSEFLLTKPLSRKSIFVSKLASLSILVLIIYLLQSIFAGIGMSLFNDMETDWSTLFVMHIHGLVLILFFSCIGVLISMFVKPKKNFMGMVVGIVFGSYFLDAIGKATEATNWISYISPFHYLSFSVNDPDFQVNYLSALVLLLIGAAMLVFSYTVYKKKDIGA